MPNEAAISAGSWIFASGLTVATVAEFIRRRTLTALLASKTRLLATAKKIVLPSYAAAVRSANARATLYLLGGLIGVPLLLATMFIFGHGLGYLNTRLLLPLLVLAGTAAAIIIVFVAIREGILRTIDRQAGK